MIRHIVLFKMKEGQENQAKKLGQALALMKEKTGGLMLECEVGFDVIHAKNSYDVVLNSVFQDTGGLEKYRIHPEHVKILDFIAEACSATVKVDYTC